MAKVNKTQEKTPTKFDRSKLLGTLLKEVRKQTGSESFKDSQYSKVSDWFDSGDIMLNALISASIKRGYPSGRTILIAGETQSGKTQFILRAISKAVKKKQVDHIFWFDSEGGAGEDMLTNFGVPSDMVEFIPPLVSIEDAATKIIAVFERIAAIRRQEKELIDAGEMDPSEKLKIMMVLDSLGALVGEKFFNDAEKAAEQRTKALADGKDPMDIGGPAQDMGAEAKLINKLIKASTQRALLTDSIFFVVNHVIANPSPFASSKILSQRGGKGIAYMCRVGLQMIKKLDKNGDDSDVTSYYKGTLFNVFSTKNSFARPFLEINSYLDFDTGPVKYHGAFDFASSEDVGLIIKGSKGWIVPKFNAEKQFKEEDLRFNRNGADKAWAAIEDDLEEQVKKFFAYSSEHELLEAEATADAEEAAVKEDGSIE